MATVRERIQAMDDFQVVRFFEAFGEQLLSGSRTSLDDVKSGVPASARGVAGWQQLENLTPEQADQVLPPAEAAATARHVLLQLSNDPTLGPLLEKFAGTYRDDELVADVILAVGLVASVILVAASTEFEGKLAGVTFKKGKVDPETLKALVGPFATTLAGLLKT